MALIKMEDPAVRHTTATDFALFALGFRPFYLLAAAFAALAIPVWVLMLSGVIVMPLPGVLWHAHEMIFGFAVAVIIGFLYTAGRNWTGLPTPTGALLASLAGLWLAGRVGLAISAGPLAALIDVAFLPAAAVGLGWALVKAGSRRNYFILVLLGVLATANAVFHLARLGMVAIDPLRSLWFALGLITLLETIIGGRVIPMFTASTLRGVRQWQHTRLNQAAIAATGFALLAWVLDLGPVTVGLASVAAILQTVRCLGWNPWATRHTPLLWILHLGHGWIPAGLLLLAGVELDWLPRSVAVHAFAIGATGGLIIGMITRTALGHTGRLLVPGKIEIAAYAFVQLAAVSRVLTLLALPAAVMLGIHLAATLWAVAFALYFVRYLPWLWRARPDGRPG